MSPVLKFGTAALFAILLSMGTALADDKCLTCHEATGDKPSSLFRHDVHFAKGISCAGCHGGNASAEDMEVAMDRKAGFIGVPKGDEISRRCTSCHGSPERMKGFGSSLPTDQWENLQASVHSKLSISGKEHIVQCTTCHDVHGIVSVKDASSPVYPLNVVKTCAKCHSDAAFMRTYNPSMPVDQLDKYRTSVHGMLNAKGDPKTAECASCHGSHDIRSAKDLRSRVAPANVPVTCGRCHSDPAYMKPYKIPTDQLEKFTKSVHGIALLQKRDRGAPACNSCHGNHGAAPPGLASISKVCGTCHALNADLFAVSPHKKAYDQRGLPECETCHGNHEIVAATDKLLGVSPEAVCSKCHTDRQNTAGFVVARTMRQLIDSIESAERSAGKLIDDAEQKGMEVSEPKFRLRDVRQARLQSRTQVHSFNEENFRKTVEPGIRTAEMITQDANEAVKEYYFRRLGLGISTIIITILAVSLFLYVRRLERHRKPGSASRSHSHHTQR
jgi:predicted CXXCH cytochrome family protein